MPELHLFWENESREIEEREEDRNVPHAVAHQAAAKEMDGCESKEGQLGNSASDDWCEGTLCS